MNNEKNMGSSDNFGNLNDKFFVYYNCSKRNKDNQRVWDVEITDHNQITWRKEMVCEDPPSKEELIKSYWINKNSFNEVFLTLAEEEKLEEAEQSVNLLKKLREYRRNNSDQKNANLAHNITFEEEKPLDPSPRFDNTL